MGRELRKFLNEQAHKAAREEAQRLEDEARLFIRMGYEQTELELVVFRTGVESRCEIWPRSMTTDWE